MPLTITEKVEYEIKGIFLNGVIRKRYGGWDFTQNATFDIRGFTSSDFEKYIKECQQIKEFLDSILVSEELSK